MSKETPQKTERRKSKREAYKPNPPKVKVGKHECKFEPKLDVTNGFVMPHYECTICGHTKIKPIPTKKTKNKTKGAFGRAKNLYLGE